MAVVRCPTSGHRVSMTNYHLRDPMLSLKAKGLLSLMLCLPPEWEYSLAGLAVINREGRHSIRTAINELENAGYLVRSQRLDDNGKFMRNEYRIYEAPGQAVPLCSFPTTENRTEIIRDKYIDGKEDEYSVWL